jgi:hypothetical protein
MQLYGSCAQPRVRTSDRAGWLAPATPARKHLHEPHIGPPPLPSAVLGFAVIDVDTRGLDAAHGRTVDVAEVRTDTDGRPVNEWTKLLNPRVHVGATSVHGIAR